MRKNWNVKFVAKANSQISYEDDWPNNVVCCRASGNTIWDNWHQGWKFQTTVHPDRLGFIQNYYVVINWGGGSFQSSFLPRGSHH
jgi:hypothetical protein